MSVITLGGLAGAAGILINQEGQNAINVVPGAAAALTKEDIDNITIPVIN